MYKINAHIRRLCLLLFLGFFLSCDQFPKDTYKTTQKVSGGKMLVGYSENPPWVITSGDSLSGIEVELVEDFARTLDAELVWVRKNEQNLLKELEHRNIHLLISGLTQKTPWKKKISLTQPYLKYEGQQHVMAVPAGEHQFLQLLQRFLNKNKTRSRELLGEFTGEGR